MRKDVSPGTDTIEKVKPTVIDVDYWLADSLDAGHDNATMYYAWDEKAQNLRMRKKNQMLITISSHWVGIKSKYLSNILLC